LIASNASIIVYLSREFEHSKTSRSLVNLNYVSYGLAQCALILRSLDIYNYFSKPQYFSDEFLNIIVDDVKYYQEKIEKDLPSWNYCPASSIVTDERLSYWDYQNMKGVNKANLYNFVGFILENVKIT